jgi:hypothetical protein
MPEGWEENTSTTPTIEPCVWIGTANAERKCKLFATDGSMRESFSASSHITTSPVSRHSLVKAESGCSREPTGGASPALAKQRTPSESRTAITTPLADIAEQICSTILIEKADICWSLSLAISFSGPDASRFRLVSGIGGLRPVRRVLFPRSTIEKTLPSQLPAFDDSPTGTAIQLCVLAPLGTILRRVDRQRRYFYRPEIPWSSVD